MQAINISFTESKNNPDEPSPEEPIPIPIKLKLAPSNRREPVPRRKLDPPIPKRFKFGFTERRPLIPLTAAAMFLNVTTREIMGLIETGELLWAFDIRSPGAKRREARILRQSLFEYAGLYSMEITRRSKTELRQIVDLILPEEIIVPADDAKGWATKRKRRAARNFQHEMRIRPARYRGIKFPKEPVMRASEVAEYFSCLPQHVLNLIADGMFKVVRLPLGPKASPFVTRESVIQFLEKRRLS